MKPELALALERLKQIRPARVASAAAAPANGAARRVPSTAPLAPGVRVFDTVTGEEGIVEYGTTENVIVPNAKG